MPVHWRRWPLCRNSTNLDPSFKGNTMQALRPLILAGTLFLAAGSALAAPNPLSVHVLDLQSGQPTAGIGVTLEHRSGEQWRELAAGADRRRRIPHRLQDRRALRAPGPGHFLPAHSGRVQGGKYYAALPYSSAAEPLWLLDLPRQLTRPAAG
jgi:hypothetical protein